MSLLPPPLSDPYAVGARARSALSLPRSVEVELDGSPLEGVLGFSEVGGRPVLCTPIDSPLVAAAGRRDIAHLVVRSDLPDGAVLDLTGRLADWGAEPCPACAAEHRSVALEPAAVWLSLGGQRRPVPLSDFLSPAHALNRGHLESVVRHANGCHPEELRVAAARHLGIPVRRLIGAALAGLTPAGVELRWVDEDGAHARRVAFARPARDLDDLGRLLQERIDTGRC